MLCCWHLGLTASVSSPFLLVKRGIPDIAIETGPSCLTNPRPVLDSCCLVDEDVEEAMEGKEGSLQSYRLSNYPLGACCAVNTRREGTTGPGITCISSGLLLPNIAQERGNFPMWKEPNISCAFPGQTWVRGGHRTPVPVEVGPLNFTFPSTHLNHLWQVTPRVSNISESWEHMELSFCT